MGLKDLVKDYISKSRELRIVYDIDRGEIEFNGEKYRVGELSFNRVGNDVKSALREVFGDYRTVPYTFNSQNRSFIFLHFGPYQYREKYCEQYHES